jgi:hypothetical protein
MTGSVARHCEPTHNWTLDSDLRCHRTALRVTVLPAICVTQCVGDDIDVLDMMRFVDGEGIPTEDSRSAARRSLDYRRHIHLHAMIHADGLCDSSALFRVIRGSTMRFDRRAKHPATGVGIQQANAPQRVRFIRRAECQQR